MKARILAHNLSATLFKIFRRNERSRPTMRRHTLLIDADDTLWENNVFFEKLIEDFHHPRRTLRLRTRAYIRHILNETERKNIRQYGYGVQELRPLATEETYLQACRPNGQARNLGGNPATPASSNSRKHSATNSRRRPGNPRLPYRTPPPDSSSPKASPPNNPRKCSAPACKVFSKPSKSSPKKTPSPTLASSTNTKSSRARAG